MAGNGQDFGLWYRGLPGGRHPVTQDSGTLDVTRDRGRNNEARGTGVKTRLNKRDPTPYTWRLPMANRGIYSAAEWVVLV
jgi:hypothetical protein